MRFAKASAHDHGRVDVALRDLVRGVARGDEKPLKRPARDGPVREAGVAQPMEREVMALGVICEELLAIAARGDEVPAHELGAVLGGRNAQERLVALGVLEQRLE